MDTKFYDSLFEGDSFSGTKLAMGITGGDFWGRPAGCCNIYVADEAFEKNRLVSVAEVEASILNLPDNIAAGGKESVCLLVRRVNCCGEEELGLEGAIRLRAVNGRWEATPLRGLLWIEGVYIDAEFNLRLLYLAGEEPFSAIKVYAKSGASEVLVDVIELGGSAYYLLAQVKPGSADWLRVVAVDDEGRDVCERMIRIDACGSSEFTVPVKADVL